MSKILARRKDFADCKVLAVGYCEAYNLLSGRDAMAYTAGVYGWNADVYFIDGVYLCTGYRPFGKDVDYAALEKAEKAAEEAYSLPSYEEYRKVREALLIAFIQAEKARLGW